MNDDISNIRLEIELRQEIVSGIRDMLKLDACNEKALNIVIDNHISELEKLREELRQIEAQS